MNQSLTLGNLLARVLAAGLALSIFIFGLTACGGGGSSASAPPPGGGGGGGTPPPATMFMYGFLPGSTSSTYSASGFSVNTTTGALTAISGVPATTSVPNGVCGANGCQTGGSTYYPDSILYLASDADNKIRPFTVNTGTGALTEQTTATTAYTGFLTTAKGNGSGRTVQSHVGNVFYITPFTAQTGRTTTVDAFSVTPSTGGLTALAGTTVSSAFAVGVMTTPTFSVAFVCGGTNCSSVTTYAINADGSIGAQNGNVTVTGNAFAVVPQGNNRFVLSTDGTKIYAYPITVSGVGPLFGTTTNIGVLSSAGLTPNCQSGRTSQSNVVVLSCSSSNNGSTPTYVQGFLISTSGVMTAGTGGFNYTATNGMDLPFDNSGKYFFTQSGGVTNTNTEYSVDASGNITANTGSLAGWIIMPPVGEFLYLQNNNALTPYTINSTNGSLAAGTAQTLPSSGSGNQIFLFGGSSVQSVIPLMN